MIGHLKRLSAQIVRYSAYSLSRNFARHHLPHRAHSLAASLFAVLLLCIPFVPISAAAQLLREGQNLPQQAIVREVPASMQQVQLSYAPIVKKTAPAVVNIYTRKVVQQRVMSPFMNDPFFQQFFGGGLPQGMSRKRLENSLGSGVIVRPEGIIVTSNHVVAGADEITVVLSDRREYEATIISSDAKSDLAVIRIQGKGEAFPFLELKDSDEVEVGDIAIAIGNPFGVGQTVTTGIVSAIARTSLDINDINYFIQTDAAINPGNSGGALVSIDGRLIGINAAIYSKDGGNMGLGFAVPSNMVRATLAGSTGEKKNIVRPWTGINGQPVTSEVASSLGLSRPVGLLVNGLHPASEAAKAGLKVGDVIQSVNGKMVDDPSAFSYRVATMPIGSDVEVGILRSGKPATLRFKLIAPPEVPARSETVVKGRNPLAGAKIANLSPAVAEQYGVYGLDSGAVILSVDPNGAASELGLGKGDIIAAVNGQEVMSVADVLDAVEAQTRNWRITINRGGQLINVMIRR